MLFKIPLATLGFIASIIQRTAGQSLDSLQVETRSLEQIYAAAKSEGQPLKVYFGGSSSTASDNVVAAFNAQFPDIKIDQTTGFSKYLDAQIDRAYAVGKQFVDVAILQTVQDYTRWNSQARLLKYKPPTFGDISNELKDLEGAYIPVSIYQFGPFYYDSAKVPVDRIPKTYLDVLDPYWKGKMALVYPNDDDGVLHLFSLIIGRYGFQWLERLKEQDVQWVRGANAAATAIVDGIKNGNSSRLLTFTALSFSPEAPTFQVRQPEAPEQFMSWGQLLGIFSSTKAPESAKLFASWMVSKEWQGKSTATRPTILESLNAQSGHGITANNTQITKYISFMHDRETVEWWRFQVESILGLAKGEYPL
ncbi:hypothetical protein HBI52_233010 [Parastagonospora nodorum]|nr:hypothetical protein HBI52_233010 [Parastagonospora nodorum]KAH6045748.1 hypothetical protein HBI54_088500 [Parastagonospora nodorum]